MNKLISRFFSALAVVLMFTACSQDELIDNGSALPEGKYPLQIATVTIADGQPSTRVTENDDRMGSTWEVGDLIYVKFEGQDEVGTLRVTDATTGAVEVVEPIYWTSPNATVIAWHNSTGQRDRMDVSDQTGGIAYMARCETQVDFKGAANLTLSHQLSKVRVFLNGFTEPTGVTLKYIAIYDIDIDDGVISAGTQQSGSSWMPDGTWGIGDILMYATTVNGQVCFEATIMPGTFNSENSFVITQADGTQYEMGLDSDLVLEAGKVSDVTLTLQIGN